MEFYYYTLRDPLTITLIAIGVAFIAFFLKEICFYLRRIIPKKVECWFCHHKTVTSYETANSWFCGRCEQYNGFTKDGDYNKTIPNQSESKLNPTGFTYQSKTNAFYSGNKLCEQCSIKQELKIKQLAAFKPMNEKNFDKEVEHFEKQIEKAFGLCDECDSLVSKVLHNIRKELSLPKKLTAAVAKISIRGERAVFINIFLSIMLILSGYKFNIDLPVQIKEEFNRTLHSNDVIREYYVSLNHHSSLYSNLSTYSVQFLIGTGIVTNSIGFYQTNSPIIFLNSLSWILMFFLTLYPSGYENIVDILKVTASVISITISILILLKNKYHRNKRKSTFLESRKVHKNTKNLQSQLNSRPQSVSNLSTPVGTLSGRVSPGRRDSPPGISSGISNLSLGVSSRRELASQRPSSRLINPAKFNPFYKVSPERNVPSASSSRSGESEHNFNLFGKPGEYEPSVNSSKVLPSEKYTSAYSKCGGSEWNYNLSGKTGGYSQYESVLNSSKPSLSEKIPFNRNVSNWYVGKGSGLTEPTICDTFESPEPVTTIPSYSYPPSCYPCPPTLAYYFSHFPKFSPPSPIPASSTPNSIFPLQRNGTGFFWTFVYSMPFVFLILSNVLLLGTMYFKGM